MGSRPGLHPGQGPTRFSVFGEVGPVAQLLHESETCYTVPEASLIVQALDETLPSTVHLVLSGAGFICICPPDEDLGGCALTSEDTLRNLEALVRGQIDVLVRSVGKLRRDYVLGIDVYLGSHNVGQFAAVLLDGQASNLIWKSFPVGDEAAYLAGFGIQRGRESPRIVNCRLGRTAILVCHDAQAFNHRNRTLVANAAQITDRQAVIDSMDQVFVQERPGWVLNLAHTINGGANMETFARS